MSSRAGKESKRLNKNEVFAVVQVFTVVQVLYTLEEEAKKKPFLQRLKGCFFYLFFKRFDIFFQD